MQRRIFQVRLKVTSNFVWYDDRIMVFEWRKDLHSLLIQLVSSQTCEIYYYKEEICVFIQAMLFFFFTEMARGRRYCRGLPIKEDAAWMSKLTRMKSRRSFEWNTRQITLARESERWRQREYKSYDVGRVHQRHQQQQQRQNAGMTKSYARQRSITKTIF